MSSELFPLSRFVEEVRVVAAVPGRALEIDRLPDGRTTIVFRSMDGGRAGDITLMGPRTHATFKRTADMAAAVVVSFRPGWSTPLLGVRANELTDRYVPIDAVWGRVGRDLVDQLVAARGLPEIIERLTAVLAGRARQLVEPASGALARRAVALLDTGEDRIDRVAEQLGVTARHLRRVFLESVGIGPKDYARTTRLQRAVRTASTSSSHDWAWIAADAGYYDQAHLIADFHQLVGLTPGAYVRRQARADGPAASAGARRSDRHGGGPWGASRRDRETAGTGR